MRFLRAQSDLPWLCAGDFNEVLAEEEQIGGNGREQWQMAGFQEVGADCDLFDLGFHGLPYTWDNRKEGNRNVKARLDRTLADTNFLNRWGDTSVQHIQLTESDHCALLIQIHASAPSYGRRNGGASRPFRYENMWQRHEEYEAFIQQAWDPGIGASDLCSISNSLTSLQSSLSQWDRDVFGSIKRHLRWLRSELEKERGNTLYRGPTHREKQLMRQLSEMVSREEAMEHQRSRVQWLREGDKNTEYFQAKAKARARTNKIKRLRRQDGSWTSEQMELEQMAAQFYQNLFMAQENLQPDLVCQFVHRKVTDQMNSELDRPFTCEEIEKALFSMKPNKSPGVDGFTAGFFQKHWSLIKSSVLAAVLGFLNGGDMPAMVNKTLLVLIPKVAHPQELAQFRPISLCTVLYKICSKAMANRLCLLLDEIISDEQSAFVPGRLITDNVVIAYECIHYLRNRKGKQEACALKLDMAKAYDRVEWSYLEAVMQALGFSENWCALVMKCVTSVTFSVRVNGSFSSSFTPSRGIRQGDPISPYLFLLCAEGLTCMLKNSGPAYISRGVRVSRHAPWISHLLFADDSLIFMRHLCGGRQEWLLS